MTVTSVEAQALSVQGAQVNSVAALGLTLGVTERTPLLPAYGSQNRERALRRLYRNNHNTLIQGSFAGLASKVVSTPFEVNAPNGADAENAQAMLRLAHFGKGFEWLFSVTVLNYLCHDRGAFWELIGYGDPDKALVGSPVAVANLDPLRCYPTGDREYPVLYFSTTGKLHRMHRTRIVQFVDMPGGDDDYPDVGLCALSRAVAIADREILMGRYIAGRLDDKPKPGFAVARNLQQDTRDAAFARFRDEQGADERPEWGQTVWFFGVDPTQPVEIDLKSFSEAPEKFDFPLYVQLNVNELALALGVDKQELWELTGGGIGTGTQSQILAAKSRGKTFGKLLKMLERALNFSVLPPDCEFAFAYRDPQEDLERAAIAERYAGVAQTLNGLVPQQLLLQMLANQVEPLRDVLLDEQGRVRLPDDDVAPQQATVDDAQNADANDPASAETPQPGQQQVTLTKAWNETRANATGQFMQIVVAARDGDITKRSLSIRMRGWLKRLGEQAYKDGMVEGGIDTPELDEDDRIEVQSWLVEQSSFVRDFSVEVFDKGLSDVQIAQRAEAWVENSLGEMRLRGIASVNANALYEWVMKVTAEHCRTCKALHGQVHRIKDYLRFNLRPKSAALECFVGCECELRPATGKVRGRLRSVPYVRSRKAHSAYTTWKKGYSRHVHPH